MSAQVLTVSSVPNVSSAGAHDPVKVLVVLQMSTTGMKKQTNDQLKRGLILQSLPPPHKVPVGTQHRLGWPE